MAKTPRNIVQPMGYLYPDGATELQFKRAFLKAGYGITKFKKWWDLYISEEILFSTGQRNESGDRLYSCIWWA